MEQGMFVDDIIEEDDEKRGSDEEKEDGSDSESELVEVGGIEKERSHITTVISVAISGTNVVKDNWIVVDYDKYWYPGQFVKLEKEQDQMKIHFKDHPQNAIGLIQ